MTTTPSSKKEKRGAADFRLFVSYILEHHTVPDVSLNGNMGIFIEAIEALLETLRDDGYEGFVRDLKALQSINKDVNEALSYREPKEDEGDRRTHLIDGRRVFNLMSMDDVDCLPDIKYLIYKILQTQTVSLLFGDASVGKTFLALHFALCIAYGLPMFGRKVEQGRVLYIYAEGIKGLKPRLQAWRKHHNQQKTDAIQFIGFPVHLLQETDTLLATISHLEQTTGEKYALVVIDTFSNCTIGTNQNDQMEIGKVFAIAHEIVRSYGPHVLVVHHTNNTGKFNGSAAFRNHVDTMIELKRESEYVPLVMHSEKQRDDEAFPDIHLDRLRIDLDYFKPGTFEFESSCVVVASTAPNGAAERAHAERETMLDILKEHGQLTRGKWQEHCTAKDITRRDFSTYTEYLKIHGLVSWTPEKPKNGQAVYFKAVEDEDEN